MGREELSYMFDDLVYERTNCWTQVCQKCITDHDFEVWDEVPIDKLICGVKNCTNFASYYLDIEMKE